MKVSMNYIGRSQLRQQSGGQQILDLAPNLTRDRVALDAALKEPIRFREAISALHDVVINDFAFDPPDKAAYEEWRKQQGQREAAIQQQTMKTAREMVAAERVPGPSAEMKQQHSVALNRYWKARSQLDVRLREENQTLWRQRMPLDPIVTVADDVVFFESFSTDESSYGCLTIDRDSCLANAQTSCLGTTNVDYSQALYRGLQFLRTYRQTRLSINPEGFPVQTSDQSDLREEQIELPDGWLRGFLQLQAAMALPMKKVTLGIDAVYSLLAWMKRHREKSGPRAIRFELQDGKPPRLVLEPWDVTIDSPGTVYRGDATEPVRIWGRRRLLSLARILPLATHVDVFLPGTGLPSFWVAQLGGMRLTLGLSGWTREDWTRGSAIQLLLPSEPGLTLVDAAAEQLSQHGTLSLSRLSSDLRCAGDEAASIMNQLVLRGQAIFDLQAGIFRWRQLLPMALSDQHSGPLHPELVAAQQLFIRGVVKVETREGTPRGGSIVTGKVENQSCEVLVDSDGIIRKGKCRCSWHFRFGVRNGPCRHLQALRDRIWMKARETSRE